MKTFFKISSLLVAASLSFQAHAIKVGDAAPDFTLKDGANVEHKLSDVLKPGKEKTFVVLEWLNFGCPFVKKHYETNNMQNIQKEFVGKKFGDKKDTKVVWYSVVSSAEGSEGFMTPAETLAAQKKHGSAATAILIDANGAVGNKYEAKTTPHMFIINPEGKVVYNGAIDNKPTTDKADVTKDSTKALFKNALQAALANKTIEMASNKPYGCSVKYKN